MTDIGTVLSFNFQYHRLKKQHGVYKETHCNSCSNASGNADIIHIDKTVISNFFVLAFDTTKTTWMLGNIIKAKQGTLLFESLK